MRLLAVLGFLLALGVVALRAEVPVVALGLALGLAATIHRARPA